MRRTDQPNRCQSRQRWVLLLLLMAALLNACTLQKAMRMQTYEDFAEISNSIWTNLYFAYHKPTVPNYGKVIYTDTVWKSKDSPVLVDQNLYILPGVTLTIEPGVKILIGERVRITCRGLIKAVGDEAAPVVFTWKDEGHPWETIECLSATDGNREDPGTIEFKHCIVEYGRGVRINSSQMAITHSVFRHHASSAIQIEYASGSIADNKVYANSTENVSESGNGAGIKVFTNGSVRVENNQVHDNASAGGRDGGGGIYAFAYDGGKVLVSGNTVAGNRSDRKGGGIFAYDALIKDNVVRDNTSAMTGGGIYVLQAVAQNNVVSGNRSDEGGGIFSKDADVVHNLIMDNRAPKGSGIFHLGAGTIEKNSLAGNQGDTAEVEAAITMLGNAEVRHNNIIAERGYALQFLSHYLSPDLDARRNYWGTINPKIIEKVIYDWMEDSQVGLVEWEMYADGPITDAYPFPENTSQAITAVTEPLAPGTVRGAIEEDTVWGGGPISSYTVAGNLLIREGCTLMIDSDTSITVAQGVTIRIRGRLSALGEEKRPVVFTANPDKPWDRLLFENRSLGKSEQESGAGSRSLLAHCTIENGAGVVMDGQGANLLNCLIRNHRASGIRIKEVAVTIKGCTIQDNTSDADGGGIYAYGSRPINIHGNVIIGNRAKDGGGIFAYGYQSNVAVDMRNNVIRDNVSQADGGGVWASRSAIVNNRITENIAGNNGGGLHAGFALVNDNHISANSALIGGGVYGESNNRFIGNTIEKNTSQDGMGGGVYLNYWGLSKDNKAFSNNLVKGNKTRDGCGTGGICLNGAMDFNRNAIFNNAGVQLNNLTPSDIGAIKAGECYWGTTDPDKIAKMIHDGRDDTTLSVVEYTPVASSAAITGQRDPAKD